MMVTTRRPRRSLRNRFAHLLWGLFIGALIGACGLAWMALHHDVWIGLARSAGMALMILAICSRDDADDSEE